MDDQLILKNRLKIARAEKNLSQGELAKLVGVSRQTIISIESGKYTASLPLAYKLSHFFGCTIEEVFNFDEEEL